MSKFYSLLTALTLLGIPAAHALDRTPSPQIADEAPVVESGGDVHSGKLIRMTPPAYPRGAEHAQVSGLVKLEAWVGRDGKVVAAQVVSGPNMLRKAAQDAVLRWQYEPTVLNGKPVDRIAWITIDFLPSSY